MATYVNHIDVDVLNQTVNAVKADPEMGKCRFRAKNRWVGGCKNVTRIEGFYAAKQDIAHPRAFEAEADEPALLAGDDSAANPVEHLLHALASCLTTSLVAHAAARGIEIDEVESQVEGDIDINGFLGLNPNVPRGYQTLRVQFAIKSNAPAEKLRELAEFSPIYNTLMNGAKVELQVQKKPTVSEQVVAQPA